MYPRCSICSDAFSPEEDRKASVLKRCGHVFCRECLDGILASPTSACPYRCNGNGEIEDDDTLALVLSVREAKAEHDLPFAIVKRTSEIHRARTLAEEKVAVSQSDLALLSDSVSNQVSTIAFKERCIAGDKAEATAARYRADELEKKLRSTLQTLGALRKAEYARRRKGPAT